MYVVKMFEIVFSTNIFPC